MIKRNWFKILLKQIINSGIFIINKKMKKLKNIIVTGSSQGIGYGIVRKLAENPKWNIIMACKNIQRAHQSRDEILKNFNKASVHAEKLDITDAKSIQNFAKTVNDKFKTIDVLINNAGIYRPQLDISTLDTNFYGTIRFTDKILKNIVDYGKIIFIGSQLGKITPLKQQLKNRFRNPNMTRKQLFELMKQFQNAVDKGKLIQEGWVKSCYSVSKMGINHFARVLSNQEDIKRRNIQVYSQCPGYLNDGTGKVDGQAFQRGCLTALYLAQLPSQVDPNFQGKFFEKSKVSSLQ